MKVSLQELDQIARRIRGRIVEMSHRAETPHLGGCLSCVDILVAAYWSLLEIDPARPGDAGRDRLILSKGHAALALYVTLCERGFFDRALLDTFAHEGSILPEQPAPFRAPGVEAATGSLGHGLSIGVGMALAARIQRQNYRVLVVMSDGECNEGSVWEAAMFAARHRLERLAVFVDYNKWQATGPSNEILGLHPLRQKWEAFGWDSREIDGHDLAAVTSALTPFPAASGRPVAVIGHTIKGRGVSFMQDDNNWHYRIPTAEEVQKARKELGLE